MEIIECFRSLREIDLGIEGSLGMVFEGCIVLFPLVWAALVGLCLLIIAWEQVLRPLGELLTDRCKPRLTVPVKVVERIHMRDSFRRNGPNHRRYVAVEVDSGDRMELRVSDTLYRAMEEGRRGHLTFQGNVVLHFDTTWEDRGGI